MKKKSVYMLPENKTQKTHPTRTTSQYTVHISLVTSPGCT
jgi:hypothetical protein